MKYTTWYLIIFLLTSVHCFDFENDIGVLEPFNIADRGWHDPTNTFEWFGYAVSLIGDINQDGVLDLAVGDAAYSEAGIGRGAIWILFMNRDGTVKESHRISELEGGFDGRLHDYCYWGSAIAPMGDLDGNGVVDLAVSASYSDIGGSETGALWILFMDRNGTVLSTQEVSAENGNFTGTLEPGGCFGSGLSNIGDLNNDGVDDLVVGQYLGGVDEVGAVWILFMNSDGTVKTHQKIEDNSANFTGTLYTFERFGSSVTSISDINGDGIQDIAVGAYYDNDAGVVEGIPGAIWILFMNRDGTVKNHQKISNLEGYYPYFLTNFTTFGYSMCNIGDMNQDGIPDIAVGGPTTGGGVLWILFLNRNGTVKMHHQIRNTDYDYFGASCSALGNITESPVNLAIGQANGKGDLFLYLFENTDPSTSTHVVTTEYSTQDLISTNQQTTQYESTDQTTLEQSTNCTLYCTSTNYCFCTICGTRCSSSVSSVILVSEVLSFINVVLTGSLFEIDDSSISLQDANMMYEKVKIANTAISMNLDSKITAETISIASSSLIVKISEEEIQAVKNDDAPLFIGDIEGNFDSVEILVDDNPTKQFTVVKKSDGLYLQQKNNSVLIMVLTIVILVVLASTIVFLMTRKPVRRFFMFSNDEGTLRNMDVSGSIQVWHNDDFDGK